MPPMMMQHEVDPAEQLRKELGDLSKLEIFNNQILCAIYLRPEKTKSGIYVPDKNRDEDRYQSKMGLVVKIGPSAFDDKTGEWFKGVTVKEGDWLILRPSDGWSITVKGVLCRLIEDVNVKGRNPIPDEIW
jgi:co-chaperonin GroES (HSP10)